MRTNPIFQAETLANVILQIRSGRAISRTTLGRTLGISPSTVGMYVDRLIEEKFLDEYGIRQGPLGRPRRLLKTRHEAGWFAGVEFNAQRVQVVGVDFSGKAVASVAESLPAEVDTQMIFKVIYRCIATLAGRLQGSLLSVGLGVPGLVDPKNGMGLHYAFIFDWNNVPVCQKISAKLGVPVILQNNLRAIALAERWFGLGHDLNHYVILGPRSGFGVAMVQNGVVLNGAQHAAGEVGRWPWPLGGSGEVKSQELHHVLSAPATWRRLAGFSTKAKLPEDLRAALAVFANGKSPQWNAVCMDFARVIGCLQLLTDTEVFILHGPLTVLGESFCESITQAVHSLSPALAQSSTRIVSSTLGDDAGALGAASLAMEAWSPV